MRSKNVMPIFALIVLGLVVTLAGVLFTQAMYSADYAASNNTGNRTASTNTTAMISGTESMVAWGMGVLIFVLVIALIFWKFFVK